MISASPSATVTSVAAAIAVWLPNPTAPRQHDDPPLWTTEVRPILSEHCFACHGPDPKSRAGGLRLDVVSDMLDKDALDLDAPADSELLYRVTTDDEFDHMPPADAGRSLTDEEVATLKRWIETGADWEPHWAYAPFADDGQADDPTSIDGWLAQGSAGEAQEPQAAPRDLLRRLYFDVAGLPPSHGDITAFAEAPTEAAYAAHVDALLESVDFAEHWARHWLDIARYADSHGYTIDGGRSVWPWRDWVVRAIADDMPFDQFTVEQLAGDLLPNATRSQRIATGFHRNTQVNQEGGAKDEENRINAVIDRVATTGSVWLGSSVACAQCHTHKFDPITHSEYFGLFAFFNSTKDGGVTAEPSALLARTAQEEEKASAWEAKLADAERTYQGAWDDAAAGWAVWQPANAIGSNGPELRPEVAGGYRVLGQNPVYSTYALEGPVPTAEHELSTIRIEFLPDGGPGRHGKNFVLQEVRVATRAAGGKGDWTSVAIADARADFEQDTSASGGGHYPAASLVTGSDGPGWAIKPELNVPHVLELTLASALPSGESELRLELAQEFGSNHTIGAFRVILGAAASGEAQLVPDAWTEAWQALKTVRHERPRLPTTLVLEERDVPRVTRRFERGSFLDQREMVEPGFPGAMDHFSEGQPANRLDLARWLLDPRNALVHRVTVNRFWQQIFGVGLVETESDFGLRGARPSNAGLLEWLAKDYVDSGMSRRHVLRQILLSKAYRKNAAKSRRLPGEVLRDSMLSAAGVLDRRVGGAPVQPPQPEGVFAFTQSRKNWTASEGSQRFRRSLYTRIWRSSPFPFFATFDAPSPGFICTRRGRSENPLQALALANDPMVMEIAEAMGQRLIREVPASESPDEDLAQRIDAAFRHALGRAPSAEESRLLTNHASGVAEKRGHEAAATAIARVVFNLFEFTNRP